MTDRTYENVPLQVVRDALGGGYFFGAMLDGVFVPFASRKLGGIDADLQRAAEQAAKDAPAPAEPTPPAE